MADNEILTWALRYAEHGFKVFPCHSVHPDGACTCGDSACTNIGKHPRTQHGLKDASCDKVQIERWFGSEAPLSNVAVVTGRDSGITVADIDCGPGKVGVQTWLELTREHGEPQTLMARTGSGGMHVLFTYNSALKTGNNRLGKHIDVKNDGGYVIVAPSRHKSGRAYEWENWGTPLAAMPAYMKPRHVKPSRPAEHAYTLDDVKDMLRYVPPDDRDVWRAVGIILGRAFPDSEAAYTLYQSWADTWGGTKGAGHDERMHEAFYVIAKQEADTQLSMGSLVKWARDHGWIATGVKAMNQQYAVVWMGGDCVILREHRAPDTGRVEVSFCTKSALKLFHAADPKVGRMDPVDHWLQHPAHRTYEGLVFQPGPCDPRFYNLWRGFAVEPKPGDCSLYLAHLKANICSGHDRLYRYVLAWMANVVQSPGTRPGVALVLRGRQGTGKGIFAKGFGSLFVPHFAHITNSHQLVGRFNALLKQAILVFADEAFWAGDKQAEGTLNALITEETHNIEPKGVDPFSVKNFMHLIVASNHEWVVPAASEARRWLVLDVSGAHLQDHDYFKAISEQMKNGGREALLYELLHYDGRDVDLWTVPKTAALADQKVHSMTPVEKFWFNCLKAGSQLGERRTRDGYHPDCGWQETVRAGALYDAYVASAQQAGVTRRAMEMELADALKRMVPEVTHGRVRVDGGQTRGWTFPSLEKCRAAFDAYMRWTYVWQVDQADQGTEVDSMDCGF